LLSGSGPRCCRRIPVEGYVKVAAGQIDLTPDRYEVLLRYIDRAGTDGADLMVLPEYILDVFPRENPTNSAFVARVAAAAKRNSINVIVGGWEEFEPGAFAAKKERMFANTAPVKVDS